MSVISPVFNRILSGALIEEQTITGLKLWFPTYLREFERQMNLPTGTFEPPDNYSDRNSFDAEAPEKLPKVVVIAPGIQVGPVKTGTGMYNATWRLGVGIAVGAKTEKRSNMLVKGYAAVIRAIMLQNSGLGDIGAFDIVWTEEAYDDLPIPDQVQLVKAASLFFNVDMSDVVTRGGGPVVPDEPVYDYGEVESVFVDVEPLEGG